MIESLRDNRIIKLLNRFLYSPVYMLLVALLMAASNIFSLEFPVMTAYTLLGILTVLFSPDCFPIMPMFCCGYMLFSAGNNPAADYGTHFLSTPESLALFVFLAATAAVCLIVRFVYEIVKMGRDGSRLPKLTAGFVFLGIAYMLGGFLSPYYSLRTVLFGLLEVVALCITYFFFAYTIDWSKRQGRDIALMLSAIGIGITLEIAGMYRSAEVIEALKDGTFQRSMLKSGWGVYNNVGGMMAMMIPAPFYLASTQKQGFLWIPLGGLFISAVAFTQSRSSMITAAVITVLCILFVLIYSKRWAKLWNMAMLAALISVIGIYGYPFLKEDIAIIFKFFTNSQFFDLEGRIEIYKNGIQRFMENPVFGSGFYVSDGSVFQYGSDSLPEGFFLPPRYHNTLIQLLASGGVFAVIAYLFHRVQTVWLVLKQKSAFSFFMWLSILSLLIGSLADCHFFNFGPGLTYGVLLVCMEKIHTEEVKRKRPLYLSKSRKR